MSLPDWPLAFRPPLFAATIREKPEDFDVTEELGFEISGDGEHDLLFVLKIGTNTEWLARQLAKFADVPAKDVGYSGLKDRNAVTRQWFSVPRWNQPDWTGFDIDGVTILQVNRNAKKLRRGAHKANHFKIVLRGELPEIALLEERIRTIAETGVPNYFGEQRFGRDGGNLRLADDWAAGKRLPRHKRSIAISSARSFLFNEQLRGRVLDGSWNQIRSGDVVNLDGSGSVFEVDAIDDDIKRRCAEMDIHPTAALAGDGSTGHQVFEQRPDWMAALTKARVEPGTRSLRLRVRDLKMNTDTESVTLEFSLGRGAYATSVLREIVVPTK